MKNLVRLMILVVVALISGFPQVNGQGNKTCYKIRIKYYYSDSSYWNVDTNVLKDYTLKLEQVLNNATGLNKGFILEYAGLVKIVDKIWFKWDTKMSQGAQGARMALYLDHFEKDTTILPIYLGNQRMFTITYPSNEYNWTLCNPVMGYPNFKSNVVLLVRNDSLLNYNVPFYINVGARGILTKMNIGKYPIDGYIMSNNIWLITNIWDPASISGMNVITPTCIPIVSEKCGITNLQNVGISSDDIDIINGVILNDNFKKISIYSIMGQLIVVSKEDRIYLNSLKGGLYLIQSDQKIPMKYFVTH